MEALSKRVDEYDLIKILAPAPAGSTFGQIPRGDIDFARRICRKYCLAE